MKFGYTILYVDDVAATIAFYTRAFGLSGKVLAPDEYGELSTGTTKLAFAAQRHVKELFPTPFGATRNVVPASSAMSRWS